MPGPRPDTHAPPRAPSGVEARQQREAQALRDNLRRRKEQARTRQAASPDAAPGGPPDDPLPQPGGDAP